jgi:hypothetical protein
MDRRSVSVLQINNLTKTTIALAMPGHAVEDGACISVKKLQWELGSG